MTDEPENKDRRAFLTGAASSPLALGAEGTEAADPVQAMLLKQEQIAKLIGPLGGIVAEENPVDMTGEIDLSGANEFKFGASVSRIIGNAKNLLKNGFNSVQVSGAENATFRDVAKSLEAVRPDILKNDSEDAALGPDNLPAFRALLKQVEHVGGMDVPVADFRQHVIQFTASKLKPFISAASPADKKSKILSEGALGICDAIIYRQPEGIGVACDIMRACGHDGYAQVASRMAERLCNALGMSFPYDMFPEMDWSREQSDSEKGKPRETFSLFDVGKEGDKHQFILLSNDGSFDAEQWLERSFGSEAAKVEVDSAEDQIFLTASGAVAETLRHISENNRGFTSARGKSFPDKRGASTFYEGTVTEPALGRKAS